MEAVYEHQFKYREQGRDKPTHRQCMWIHPKTIEEYKFLEQVVNELKDSKILGCGWTGIDNGSMIVIINDKQ